MTHVFLGGVFGGGGVGCNTFFLSNANLINQNVATKQIGQRRAERFMFGNLLQ